MSKKTDRNSFMIKYGKLDHAQHFAIHGDITEKYFSVDRLVKDGTKEEAAGAFEHYFNHAMRNSTTGSGSDPGYLGPDPWYLGHVIGAHPDLMQSNHIEQVFHANVPAGVKYNVVKHEKASPDVLRHAMNHPMYIIREAAVLHKNAPDDVILKGMTDDAPDVVHAAKGKAYRRGQEWITKHGSIKL